MPSDVLFSDQQGSDEEETENAQPTTSLREGVQSYNASILLNTVLDGQMASRRDTKDAVGDVN